MRSSSRSFRYTCLSLTLFLLAPGCKKNTPPVVGETYKGGKVFFVDASGEHGLIAAPTDLGNNIGWGCLGTTINGADGLAQGSGSQNTIDILNGCAEAGTAAKMCSDLVSGGFSDWYLPSKEELNLMFQKKDMIGGFIKDNYWSSSEVNADRAWLQDFDAGNQYSTTTKDWQTSVRAIRSF
jgi:hypothetical protein